MDKWIKPGAALLVVVGLFIAYQQATARAKNIGIAEAKVEAAAVFDSAATAHEDRANATAARALIAGIQSANRARLDALRLTEIQDSLSAMSQRADSLGESLTEQLDAIDPELAAEFEEFREDMEGQLVAEREKTAIEADRADRAEAQETLWRDVAGDRAEALLERDNQIAQLQGALDAALDAANSSNGFFPRIKADWWVGAIGFGLGVVATR